MNSFRMILPSISPYASHNFIIKARYVITIPQNSLLQFHNRDHQHYAVALLIYADWSTSSWWLLMTWCQIAEFPATVSKQRSSTLFRGTPDVCWLVNIIMMVADALVPSRHQGFSNHHDDFAGLHCNMHTSCNFTCISDYNYSTSYIWERSRSHEPTASFVIGRLIFSHQLCLMKVKRTI